jgi:hypothetical protein
MAEMDDLTALVVNLPGAGLLTTKMKADALASALVPDATGVWPGRDGYSYTYDVYFAATKLIGFLMAQPVVRQSSSEGTSVAVDAPQWGSLLAYYRSMSPIAQATSGGVLVPIAIPDGPHVYRTDMSGHGGDGYDDVDTDVG